MTSTNIKPQEQFNLFERDGQIVIGINVEAIISEDAQVRKLSAQLEELEYGRLYKAYSDKGRKSAVDAKVMFKIMVYAYNQGIRSTRKIEEACRNRVDFMWLLGNEPVPDHSTISRFRTGRLEDAIEDLFYQYVNKLEEWGETDHEVVFIDGTKLESRAGKYMFVWRGTCNKNIEKIQKNVKEKTGIEDLDELDLYVAELKAIVGEIPTGKGHRKTEEQREYCELEQLRQRWHKNLDSLKIMGPDRNSYAKTDKDATFMHMKEDAMRNGQLKPAYNVQIAVNSEYITGIGAYSNRTDYGTLEPFLNTIQEKHGRKYTAVTADSGYESTDNYLYLEENGQISFIKPQNYEQAKTKKYRSQIGRAENMEYDSEEDCYICANGKKLTLVSEYPDKYSKRKVMLSNYKCENCTGCPLREACCKAKDSDKPKVIKIKKDMTRLRAQSLENISSDTGITYRINRSIQVEGAFGLLKTDFGFRRFLTVGKKNIQIELFFLALGFNTKKSWMKEQKNRTQTHLIMLNSA